MKDQIKTIQMLGAMLESASIPYTFVEESALVLQGMTIPLDKIDVLTQWDVFSKCQELFVDYPCSEVMNTPISATFEVQFHGLNINVGCVFNTTIKTDPYRIAVDGIWCKSLYSYIYGNDFSAYQEDIVAFLLEKQQTYTAHNEQAWNQNNYQALIERYGEPSKIAEKIKQNPEWRLHPFYKYMNEIEGKKVIHLLGSNGVKGTALALLGADVTVVDFSQENAMFAKEVAKSANASLDYVVSDVFSINEKQHERQYDYVLMELGVLHYFITLEPLMKLVSKLLVPGGRFVLHEFHPISTKLITSSGKKHKVTGNYFNPELSYNTVAFSKHMPDGVQEELMQTVQRKWTIGELVTAAATSGLCIEVLEEEPNHKLHDVGLPKTYTLVATTR
ncbi:class I SAM-dependent methyltransferase [Bacillus massiliigorillae]|uniref:class I SAM-dependent methyltransferase n=1 Tax=Bacillus massiliigorillae TaxID=1243664 RepID=UPI0003AB19EA|nr:methyltransferase domain-containing protein [Bacillus massiliigorillae]